MAVRTSPPPSPHLSRLSAPLLFGSLALYPLLWLSLAFLTGILLASLLPLPTSIGLIVAGTALLLAILVWLMRPRLSALPFPLALPPALPFLLLLTCFLALGAARYQASLPQLDDPAFIAYYNDHEEEFLARGVLIEPPDVRDSYINLRVQVSDLQPAEGIGKTEVDGLLLVKALPGGEWQYGDEVLVRARLQTPPVAEDFSYREYLARHGIYSYAPYASVTRLSAGKGNRLFATLYGFKTRALAAVYQLWPDPEASLLAGILLGVETGIPQPVQQAFKNTGTSHIIAISGFNVSIIAALFVSLFGRLLGVRKGAIAAVVGIALYTLLVGAEPSVVRAAVMGGFSLFARQLGRRQHGLTSLSAIAALMCLANPRLLWEPGFQLSFAATLGLILYAQPLQQAFVNFLARLSPPSRPLTPHMLARLSGPIGEYFLFTLAAQLVTLPIIAYHFRRVSLVSLLTNPLILPAQPPIMILGGLALLLGALYLPLGRLVAPLVWPFIAFTIRTVEFLGKIPGGVLILGNVAILWVVLFYGLLFLLTGVRASRYRKILPPSSPAIALTGLGILTVMSWRAFFAAPDGLLHLTLLDVAAAGQTGEVFLIQTPTGRFLLVNGGPSASLLSDALGRRLPFYNRKLDVLIVASQLDEQLAALPRTIERYPPANVLWAGSPNASRSSRLLQQTLAAAQIPLLQAQSGQVLDLGSGATLKVLTSGKRGAILLLEWQRFRALLPLGAQFEDLDSLAMGRNVGNLSTLLLADHGYAPLNPSEWIANLHPQVILLSVEAGNWSGLPSPETLQTIAGYPLLRTDQNGWIHLSTDGENLWSEVAKR